MEALVKVSSKRNKQRVFKNIDEFKKYYLPRAYAEEQKRNNKPGEKMSIYIGRGIRRVLL